MRRESNWDADKSRRVWGSRALTSVVEINQRQLKCMVQHFANKPTIKYTANEVVNTRSYSRIENVFVSWMSILFDAAVFTFRLNGDSCTAGLTIDFTCRYFSGVHGVQPWQHSTYLLTEVLYSERCWVITHQVDCQLRRHTTTHRRRRPTAVNILSYR